MDEGETVSGENIHNVVGFSRDELNFGVEFGDSEELALLSYGVWVRLFGESKDEVEMVSKEFEGGSHQQVVQVSGSQMISEKLSIESGVSSELQVRGRSALWHWQGCPS